MWFDNLLTLTELLRFYYVMKKIQEQPYNTFFFNTKMKSKATDNYSKIVCADRLSLKKIFHLK